METINSVSLKITLKLVNNSRMKKSKYIDNVKDILISNNTDFVPSLFERIEYSGTLEEKVSFRIQQRLNEGFHYVLALNENDEVIGFTEFKINTTKDKVKAFNIGTSAVSKSFHGNGIAKMLYGFIDELAAKLKVAAVFRGTWSLNKRQIKLYERFGYKEVRREVGMRGNGNDLITFCKVIEGR